MTPVLVQDLHDAGEVEKRPRQAIHLVDHHAVHQTVSHIVQQTLHRKPVHVGASETAVVVLLGQRRPALVSLADDEGLGGLALGVQRIEV